MFFTAFMAGMNGLCGVEVGFEGGAGCGHMPLHGRSSAPVARRRPTSIALGVLNLPNMHGGVTMVVVAQAATFCTVQRASVGGVSWGCARVATGQRCPRCILHAHT